MEVIAARFDDQLYGRARSRDLGRVAVRPCYDFLYGRKVGIVSGARLDALHHHGHCRSTETGHLASGSAVHAVGLVIGAGGAGGDLSSRRWSRVHDSGHQVQDILIVVGDRQVLQQVLTQGRAAPGVDHVNQWALSRHSHCFLQLRHTQRHINTRSKSCRDLNPFAHQLAEACQVEHETVGSHRQFSELIRPSFIGHFGDFRCLKCWARQRDHNSWQPRTTLIGDRSRNTSRLLGCGRCSDQQ